MRSKLIIFRVSSSHRRELEFLRSQQLKVEEDRVMEEEERKKEAEQSRLHVEQQKKYLEELRQEQEHARQKAEVEIRLVRERIQKEQQEEKQRLESEMKRLLALEEKHRSTVQAKELEMNRIKEELEKKWKLERQQVETQRAEVEALQQEIEAKRREVEEVESQARAVIEKASRTSNKTSLSDAPQELAAPEADAARAGLSSRVPEEEEPEGKSHIEALRERLRQLEGEYEDLRKVGQKEIREAKDALQKAEQDALEGLRSLTMGKSAIESQWQRLADVQAKHRQLQEHAMTKIRDVRELLEHAEEAEEASLIEKERMIMDRRAARMKADEARRRLEEMEHEDGGYLELSEADFAKKREMLESETREEIKDIKEERKILTELYSKHQHALQKATQMVTETKIKLEKHLESDKLILVPLREKVENLVRNELGPLIELEHEIEKRCEDVDRENRDRKKLIYKQRRRIVLLERQHNHAMQQAEKETLNEEELEELENEREAEKSLIRKEKMRLLELEKKHKEQQEVAELTIGEAVQDLEKRKARVNQNLEQERKKLTELEAVHKETLEHVEDELGQRTEILHRVKDKVQKDKRQLAKLDVRQQRCASKAAEELFLMAELLEKEMTDRGKSDELAKIKEHRKRLQELDRQLKMAERKERGGRGGGDEEQQCMLYWLRPPDRRTWSWPHPVIFFSCSSNLMPQVSVELFTGGGCGIPLLSCLLRPAVFNRKDLPPQPVRNKRKRNMAAEELVLALFSRETVGLWCGAISLQPL